MSAWARDGPGGAMSCHGAEPGMRGRWGWCTVLWLFQNCCSRGHLLLGGACLDHGDASDNAYSQCDQKLNASVGGC